MSINWSEFRGQLPRLAGVVSFCFVRRSRGTVPVVEPGEEKAWGTFLVPVWRVSREWSQVLHSGARWEEQRQQVWIEVTEVCVHKAFFTLRCEVVGLGNPESFCRLLLWKLSKSSWIKPWESRCDFTADSALSLNQSPPDVLFHLNYPMALSSVCQQSSCSRRLWASLFRAAWSGSAGLHVRLGAV